ncbi:MAG TPA: DUF4337 family protein [Candidatus Elarobacter sp.]|jgi:hypothetical protein|nr:DUF4337 family protein [Candidatus Elarobacter sp.]
MSAAKSFEEAHERHEHGREGPRWVPIAAATLAVLAAIAGYFGNLRSTQALVEKNDAIVATTHASDTWSQYQAGRIKYYVATTALDQGVNAGGSIENLKKTAASETAKGPPLMEKAKGFEEEAARHNEHSERLLKQHETIEVAATLFEVAIVLVSITALVGSRLLPISAGIAAVLGIGFFVAGLTAK